MKQMRIENKEEVDGEFEEKKRICMKKFTTRMNA